MNTKQLMIYILSVVATLACSLFAGWSVRDNCGEWLSLTLLIGAGVALLMQLYFLILLSGKSKQKALYLFIHRYCSRFTHPEAWFSVSNCKYYRMHLF